MNRGRGFVAILLLQLLLPVVRAQSKESLLIGPGDMLHLQVFDEPELEQHSRVTDSGELLLTLGVSVKIAGLDLSEAGHVIEEALIRGQYVLNPKVLVSVDEFATQKVSVLGEVRLPGAIIINTPRSIIDLLSLAGGLTDLADRKVMIQHKGSSEQVSYFVSNEPSTAFKTEVEVFPGDKVIVPKAGIVYVLGDVGRPGGYTMTNNEGQISALELVARAGGTTPTAVPSHTKLIRKTANGYIEIALPLSSMQKGKQSDLQLQANDIVYVPFSYLRNFAVSGAGIAASVGSAAVYRF